MRRLYNKKKRQNIIYTIVNINNQSIIKGKYSQPSFKIKMMGGKIGIKSAWSSELMPFSDNEEVLLFLYQDQSGFCKPAGISGKLGVIERKGKKYFDCSKLKTDEVSEYGPGCCMDYQEILSRINNYLLK